MKALPEKLAEQYADDKSKTYYIGENGEKKWYITPRGQYAKEDFLAGYKAAMKKYDIALIEEKIKRESKEVLMSLLQQRAEEIAEDK